MCKNNEFVIMGGGSAVNPLMSSKHIFICEGSGREYMCKNVFLFMVGWWERGCESIHKKIFCWGGHRVKNVFF